MSQETYPFETAQKRLLFSEVTQELRCSVCQNQNLADSMAPLAQTLRVEIYQQIKEGHSKAEVVDFVVHRYGEFVLYNPPFKPNTLGLWLGPVVMLIVALLYIRNRLKSGARPKVAG